MSAINELICFLLVSCFVSCIWCQQQPTICWTSAPSEAPFVGPPQRPFYVNWCAGPDGIQGTPDDSSCCTDSYVLAYLYPTRCRCCCKIVSYQIQWFGGGWSPLYYPCGNDFNPDTTICNQRYWAFFQDHNHNYTYCS